MQSESVRWPQQSNMFPTDIKKYDVDEQLSLTICFPCRLKFLCCQYRHQLIMRSAIVRLRKEHNNNNDTLVTWCNRGRATYLSNHVLPRFVFGIGSSISHCHVYYGVSCYQCRRLVAYLLSCSATPLVRIGRLRCRTFHGGGVS